MVDHPAMDHGVGGLDQERRNELRLAYDTTQVMLNARHRCRQKLSGPRGDVRRKRNGARQSAVQVRIVAVNLDEALDERVHELFQRHGRSIVGLGLLKHCLAPREVLVGDCVDQGLLVGEVLVQRADGDACPRCNRIGIEPVPTTLDENPSSGLQQRGDRVARTVLFRLADKGLRTPPAACRRHSESESKAEQRLNTMRQHLDRSASMAVIR